MAKEAQVISERLSSRILSSELYATLARIYLNGNDNERAEEYFKYAVREDDDARASWIADEESASNLFGSRISPYYNLMELYTRSGRSADAFELSERMRSRTIVDAFRNAKIDISRAMSPEERTRESDLKLALISLNERLSKMGELSKESSAPLIEELRLKRLEFDDFRNRLHAAHPELQVHRGEMKPIALEEAASVLTDDKCTVLEYAVADDKTLLFVITIEPSNKPQLSSFVIDVKRADLLQKVEQYRQEIGQGKLGHKSQAQALYDLLLRPAASKLLGRSRLIIIPDGPLWDLPFQALQDGGKSLIERSAVSYAPSLTALREMTRTTRSRRTGGDFELFAAGNPMVGKATSDKVERVFMAEKLTPLPEAERLANELGKMYGRRRSNVYTGDAARESVVKSEAPHYRIVQFATHGILNDTNPMYSHIVLAQNNKDPNEDGLLEAWELKDLDLNADMVILSACETARGKISNGEGVIGMTWASFIAGAPTTVASQWKVESRSTTELMLEFHRQLLAKKKVSKAEALRRASLKVMKMPGFQHPSYWAGFVIVGDGS